MKNRHSRNGREQDLGSGELCCAWALYGSYAQGFVWAHVSSNLDHFRLLTEVPGHVFLFIWLSTAEGLQIACTLLTCM